MGHSLEAAPIVGIEVLRPPSYSEGEPLHAITLGVFREHVNPSMIDREDIKAVLDLPSEQDGRVVLIYPDHVELMK